MTIHYEKIYISIKKNPCPHPKAFQLKRTVTNETLKMWEMWLPMSLWRKGTPGFTHLSSEMWETHLRYMFFFLNLCFLKVSFNLILFFHVNEMTLGVLGTQAWLCYSSKQSLLLPSNWSHWVGIARNNIWRVKL